MQSRALLSVAALCAVLTVTWARPSGGPQSPEEELQPLQREARENTGFHTAHQDAGVSKYSENSDFLQRSPNHTANLEGIFRWHRQLSGLINESEVSTENVPPTTDSSVDGQISTSSQQEEYSNDNSPTEYTVMPTEISVNVSEESVESQSKEDPIPPPSTERGASFTEQGYIASKDSDRTSFESQISHQHPSPSFENIFPHSDTEKEPEDLNGHDLGKLHKEMPPKQKFYSSDSEQGVYPNVLKNSFSYDSQQTTERLTDDPFTNTLPTAPNKNVQETVMSPQTYKTKHQPYIPNSNGHYYTSIESITRPLNVVDNLNYNDYSDVKAVNRELSIPLAHSNYYSHQSSNYIPAHSSEPISDLNTNYYFQPAQAVQNTYAGQEAGRQGGDAYGEAQIYTNLRNSRSFPITRNIYNEIPEKYISPAQSPYVSTSQAPGFEVNPNPLTPLIQAPYSVTYRIFNTNVFESAGAGDSRTPGNLHSRQLSWPFANYFPIVINDPFLAAYNAFFNMFEYGPDADVCGRLIPQKDGVGVVTVTQTAQNTARFQVSPAGTTSLPPVLVPSAAAALPHLSTDSHRAVVGPAQQSDEGSPLDDGKSTEIIMSSKDTKRNATFVTKLVVRKGGVSIAGPGGVATAGSGGLAIVGPGGVAYTSPNGMAIVGPGGKVIGLPSGTEIVFDQPESGTNAEGAKGYRTRVPPGSQVVAEGPTVYYHPPQLLAMQFDAREPTALLIPFQTDPVSSYGYIFLPLGHQSSPVSYRHALLPSVSRTAVNNTRSFGTNVVSSNITPYYSLQESVLPNIHDLFAAWGGNSYPRKVNTSQRNDFSQATIKENNVPRAAEAKPFQTDQEGVDGSGKNAAVAGRYDALVPLAAPKHQNKSGSSVDPQHRSRYEITQDDFSKIRINPQGGSDVLKALEALSTAPTRPEDFTAGKPEAGTTSEVEAWTSENETASSFTFVSNSNEENTTTLVLAPRAKAVAGKNGVALATPVSNAVVARGQPVDIHFLPDAVAIAGPGGIADAHSDLFVTFVDP